MEPQDWDWSLGGTEKKKDVKKKKRKEEKIYHVCDSMDHGPLLGRCP